MLRQAMRPMAMPHLFRRTLCFISRSVPAASSSRPAPSSSASRAAAAIPVADSVSESEFYRLPEGGASALNFGEFGESPEAMRRFWFFRGGVHDDDLLDILARRAAADGGVWGDPATLAVRLDALDALLPMRGFQRLNLLKNAGRVLGERPETVRAKLEALSRALPKADVLDMATRCPQLLQYASPTLAQRIQTVLTGLPRSDMVKVIVEQPSLLTTSPKELSARLAALRASYVRETIARWPRERAVHMLSFNSKRLGRLLHLEGLNPGLRIAIPDLRILGMKEKAWLKNFVHKKMPKWRKGNTVRPEVLPRDALSPLHGIEVPERGNVFAFGRSVREARARGELPNLPPPGGVRRLT